MIERERQVTGFGLRTAMGLVAITLACTDAKEKSKTNTPTPTPEPTRVERTILPTKTATLEIKKEEPTATPRLVIIPTAEKRQPVKPTSISIPMLAATATLIPTLTSRPTARPTEIIIPTSTNTREPTLSPTNTPRPTEIAKPTRTPKPTTTPAPTPTPFPQLEACNTGKFINPVDGQEIPTRVDVRAELAHDGNYDLGCKSPTGDADVILIDTYGNRFKWDLYCFDTSPNPNDDSDCHREGVILADFSGRRWGMELKIEDLLLEKISVVIE